MRRNGFGVPANPILQPLDTIECRDAILNDRTAREAEWPDADVVIGNPPFLGVRLLDECSGDPYVKRLFSAYAGRVGSTLWPIWSVTGLSRRGYAWQRGMFSAPASSALTHCGADRTEEIWTRSVKPASYSTPGTTSPGRSMARQSSVDCLLRAEMPPQDVRLNGDVVQRIKPDLSAKADFTTARRLIENLGRSFQGPVKVGTLRRTRSHCAPLA